MATSYTGPLAGGARPPAPRPAPWRRPTAVARPGAVRLGRLALLGTAALLGVLAGFNPLYAVGALGALAFLGLLAVDFAAALALFTVLSFVESLGGGGSGLSYLKLAGAVLAGFWLVTLMLRRAGRDSFLAVHPAATIALILLVVWSGTTAVWAVYPDTVLATTYRLLPQVFLFFIVFTAVRTRRHAMLVLVAFVLGASISAGVAWTDPSSAMVNSDGLSRAAGASNHPVVLALLLVPACALSAAMIVLPRSPFWARLLAFGALGLCLSMLFLTLSRGGLVGLAVALLSALFVGGRWRLHAAALSALLLVSCIGFYAFVASPEAVERTLNPTDRGGSGRTDIWTVAGRMVAAHPVLGVGTGNFNRVSNQYLVRPGVIYQDDYILDEPLQAHNMYLNVLTDMGAIGLILFVGVITFSLWCLLQAARGFERLGDVRMELMVRALLIGVIGMLAAEFFLSEQYRKQLWLLLALGPVLWKVARMQEGDRSGFALPGMPALALAGANGAGFTGGRSSPAVYAFAAGGEDGDDHPGRSRSESDLLSLHRAVIDAREQLESALDEAQQALGEADRTRWEADQERSRRKAEGRRLREDMANLRRAAEDALASERQAGERLAAEVGELREALGAERQRHQQELSALRDELTETRERLETVSARADRLRDGLSSIRRTLGDPPQ